MTNPSKEGMRRRGEDEAEEMGAGGSRGTPAWTIVCSTTELYSSLLYKLYF